MSVKTVQAPAPGRQLSGSQSCEAYLCIHVARNMKKGKMLRDDSKDFKEVLFILKNFGHSTDQNNERTHFTN